MSAAAVWTVTSGAPGDASINRSTAESDLTLPTAARQRAWVSRARCSQSPASATARVSAAANSAIHRLSPSIAAGVSGWLRERVAVRPAT